MVYYFKIRRFLTYPCRNIWMCNFTVRQQRERKNLPKRNTKWPDIWFYRVFFIKNRFWWHPPNGHQRLIFLNIIFHSSLITHWIHIWFSHTSFINQLLTLTHQIGLPPHTSVAQKNCGSALTHRYFGKKGTFLYEMMWLRAGSVNKHRFILFNLIRSDKL